MDIQSFNGGEVHLQPKFAKYIADFLLGIAPVFVSRTNSPKTCVLSWLHAVAKGSNSRCIIIVLKWSGVIGIWMYSKDGVLF